MNLYPLRCKPVYFEKVWGGRRLETILGRAIPPGEPIGESWEVSDHPHGRSIIVNGSERGKSLHAVIECDPMAILGTRVIRKHGARFPLLVKYIDAEDKLSVQVHPDDAYAAAHEGELGKTEMWYVLHADPGACLIVGLREGVSEDEFRFALEMGNPAQLLHQMPVSTGDSIFIPAGRIHAIMPGLVILEIQQNSDTTYRLYDWGRMGLDGRPRTLHVKQAIEVANWADYAPEPQVERVEMEGANRKTVLASCPYFVVEKYDLTSERQFTSDGGTFTILNCVAGNGQLEWEDGAETLTFGDSLLVPAAIPQFTLRPEGDAAFVISYVP